MTAAALATKKPWRDMPCIEWWKSKDGRGYGQQGVGRYGKVRAHRMIYEECFGPIPDGMDIDHLCRNRGCVNPLHLEAVSRRVNLVRGRGIPAKNARKTHCPQGHEYTEANTYVNFQNGRPRYRSCRSCHREWARARRRQK